MSEQEEKPRYRALTQGAGRKVRHVVAYPWRSESPVVFCPSSAMAEKVAAALNAYESGLLGRAMAAFRTQADKMPCGCCGRELHSVDCQAARLLAEYGEGTGG